MVRIVTLCFYQTPSKTQSTFTTRSRDMPGGPGGSLEVSSYRCYNLRRGDLFVVFWVNLNPAGVHDALPYVTCACALAPVDVRKARPPHGEVARRSHKGRGGGKRGSGRQVRREPGFRPSREETIVRPHPPPNKSSEAPTMVKPAPITRTCLGTARRRETRLGHLRGKCSLLAAWPLALGVFLSGHVAEGEV
ncbi:hypothetical protein LX36DRAFT_149559 [Colletotrichum falcatum]|nr:hypothetical protein LX36DRAFT_149559 [Colletotrichum falcatum]